MRVVLVWWGHCENGAGLVGNEESGAGLAVVRVVLVWWGMVRVVLF